jgi:predicted membrane channel-forming protein YqfA (hemolysin III family)
MLEYTLAIILIVITFISAFISWKIPLIGIIVMIVDFLMLRDLAINGYVIMGYEVISSVITPNIQQFTELTLTTIIGIILNITSTAYGALKVFND